MIINNAESIREKSIEYTRYINDHIANVSKAFKENGATICKVLDINHELLAKNVASHDISKYTEAEFSAYRRHFYPAIGESPDDKAMKLALHHHIINNPHHWNHYVLTTETDTIALPIPDIYMAEMILDWIAMSYVSNISISVFFKDHSKNMIFEFNTKEKIKKVITAIESNNESESL